MVNRGLSGQGRVVLRDDRRRYGALIGNAGNRSLDDILSSVERREILSALAKAGGHRTKAAELLEISRSRLYRRMEALGIETNGSHSKSRK